MAATTFSSESIPDLRFGLGRCWLGRVLVAQSAAGLCAILLGDDADMLLQDLRERFPSHGIEQGGPDFDAVVNEVVAFLEHPETELSLPLDLRGTAFQKEVWQALTDIPIGQTMTYTALSERLGAGTTGVRAVAGACAANALAVAIPCHRVVKADGGLAGFRWGVERKRALLEREGRGIIGRENPGALHQLNLFA